MLSRLLALIGTLSLVALAAAAVIWAAQVTQAEPPLPDPPAIAEADPGPRAADRQTRRTPRPAVYYEAITERPVFSPARRPVAPEETEAVVEEPPAPEPAPEPAAAAPPAIRLLGVIGTGNRRSALVSHQGAEPAWITVGTVIEGWTLAEIGPDWIEMVNSPQRFRVEMYAQ